MQNLISFVLSLSIPVLLLPSCCKMEIDQQCYRQGGAAMVGDLGAHGQRTAGNTLVKAFHKLGYTRTTIPLEVDISEMKLVDTSNGTVTASGNAVSEQIKELANADASLTTTWDKSKSMIIRISQFKDQTELIDALNSPANARSLAYLKQIGNEARIVTCIVRAYNHKDIVKQTLATNLDASLSATGSSVELDVNTSKNTERAVQDGTIVGYQWSRLVWDPANPDKLIRLKFDTTSWD